MAETYFVQINNTKWTDISQGNVSGFFTNESDRDIFYLQNETLPLSSVKNGHSLHSCENIDFTVTAPEVVFARTTAAIGQIVVTPKL